MAPVADTEERLKRIFTLALLLLSACKREATPASTEAEALDYVRLVRVAVSNAYYETGKAVPPTPCTDDLFGMKKTSKFLKLERCTAQTDAAGNALIAAVFNGDIAVLSDAQGVRRVQVSDLPRP